ncbi:MAG: putative ferrochelatase [Phycisphaerae bacterium]
MNAHASKVSHRSQGRPFDAVLVISFGGPGGLADIRPFLANVLRGRPVPPQRVEEVAHHYELFGGVSPLTELTLRQAAGLRQRLETSGLDLPVYVGMRNWHPFLADTLQAMARAGVRRAIGFIAAAHGSYSSCTQYKENVRDARAELVSRGVPDVEITYVPNWYNHPGFIEANARHIETAINRLDAALRPRARIVFTAHSIPTRMADMCQYRQQLATSCELVARRLGREDWVLVYQSRSGRPTDPWLEPDVCDYLHAERDKGLAAAVLSPIGFLCDHIEVLYDLDREAADVCRRIGLPMARAESVNDDPAFLDMMADVVRETWSRYRAFPSLPITNAGAGSAGPR